jgi:hypothetical protein
MKDNFDLKKFLKENKTIENYNPFTKEKPKSSINEGNVRDKIKEMILKELEDYQDWDEEEVDMGIENPENMFDDVLDVDDLLEEEEADEEESEEDETEESEEDFTDEDESAFGTIAADMEGAESEVMDNLMSALNAAKGLNNEKLTTQIGNTLKFFVSEYISGGEE